MLTAEYKFCEVEKLTSLVDATDEKVEFKHIFENSNGGVSVVAFKKDQQLTRHLAPADIMVFVTEGRLSFKVLDKAHTLNAGEFILIGAGVPHSVNAELDSKMMLVKVKP